MNPELIKIAQQLMQQNPGMTPEQALQEAQRMSEGARSEDFVGGQAREAGRLGHMAQQQYMARQAQQQPGLLGGLPQQPLRPNQLPPQQPQQQPQKPPKSAAQLCAESGGKQGPDGMCHYTFNY